MTATKQSTESGLAEPIAFILRYGIAGILLVSPFYAPMTVLLASHFGNFDFMRILKELALVGLAAVVILGLYGHRKLVREVLHDKLFVLVLMYAVVIASIGVFDLLTHKVSTRAIIYGLIINLRPVGIFAVAYLALRMGNLGQKFNWKRLVLIPALIVAVFACLQATVLPKDILRHIGYSQATIVPYHTVDNQPDFVRVESTLRGPNPLGAYLVVIIGLALSLLPVSAGRRRIALGIFTTLCLVALFATYSRSAWIGTFIAATVIIVLVRRRLLTRKVLIGAAVLLACCITGLALVRNNDTVQNIFFHSSEKSVSATSSNDARAEALESGYRYVLQHPLGSGIGSAGPASLRNDMSPARLSENYFLQVGQEAGLLGLVLFVAIQWLLISRLWALRNDPLTRGLLASLIGLIFVNLVSHAWADDTLAYIWWTLAAVALSATPGVILNKKRKQYGKEQQTA